MPDLIFGLYPEKLGGEGQFILLEKKSALAASQAFKCKTWGEFARLADIAWEELVEDWGDDYADANGRGQTLRPTSRFRYEEIVFGEASGPELPHPARVAYDLVHAFPYVRDYIVARELEFAHGSPLGHLECILAPDREPFLKLREYMSRERRDPWTLEEDNRLVRSAMYGGR